MLLQIKVIALTSSNSLISLRSSCLKHLYPSHAFKVAFDNIGSA